MEVYDAKGSCLMKYSTILIIIVGIVILGVVGLGIATYWKGPKAKQVQTYSIDDPNAPKVEIPEKSFDFGNIFSAPPVKHDFKIKNVGKSTLEMNELSTSCHCTTVILKVPGTSDSPSFGMHTLNKWIGKVEPGVEATIEVTFDPLAHNVKGETERIIFVKTNDPSAKDIKLQIAANVTS